MATLQGIAGTQSLFSPEGAYTKLSQTHLTSAMRYGTSRTYNSERQLFRQGERSADLYIVLSGAIQIYWHDLVEQEERFVTLDPGEFTGEFNLLSQKETLVAARALVGSNILRIPRERLREFLIREPEIGESVVRTIVQRREWFMQIHAGGLTLIHNGESRDTEKLARFLSANSYPFRAEDLQQCPVAQCLIDQRGLHRT